MALAKLSALAVLLLGCHVLVGVHGQDGVLSVYPNTPIGQDLPRYSIGTCSRWTTLNPAVGLTATGNGTLWLYLNQGCAGQVATAFEFQAEFSINGTKPATGMKLMAHAHSGSCSSGTLEDKNQAGQVYFNNITNGTFPANMLWARDLVLPASGAVAGSISAFFVARSKSADGATESTPVKSFVIKDGKDPNALRPVRYLCCDIAVVNKPADSWFDGKGKQCGGAGYTPATASSSSGGSISSIGGSGSSGSSGSSSSSSSKDQGTASGSSSDSGPPAVAMSYKNAAAAGKPVLAALAGALLMVAALAL